MNETCKSSSRPQIASQTTSVEFFTAHIIINIIEKRLQRCKNTCFYSSFLHAAATKMFSLNLRRFDFICIPFFMCFRLLFGWFCFHCSFWFFYGFDRRKITIFSSYYEPFSEFRSLSFEFFSSFIFFLFYGFYERNSFESKQKIREKKAKTIENSSALCAERKKNNNKWTHQQSFVRCKVYIFGCVQVHNESFKSCITPEKRQQTMLSAFKRVTRDSTQSCDNEPHEYLENTESSHV